MSLKGCALYGYVALVTTGTTALMLYKTYDVLDFYHVEGAVTQGAAYVAAGIGSLWGGAQVGLRSGVALETILNRFRRENTKE
ncbi:MAG: hypothetical protein AABY13_00115 [Nanoarchaeota archaeon]